MPRDPLQPPVNPRQHVGKTLARCVVGEPLGYGRTSWVYRAQYEPLGREIALKILASEFAGEDELRARFLSEARAIAQVDHENVVKVYDVVEDEDAEVCILMELVAGETLHERIKRDGALPVKKALRIALEIARALEAAHGEGVVHRDVKPPNVMLVGGSDQVKVLDFGLAGASTKARIGTPLYMSPEACQGKRIDEKSDVYALGVCLYKMLTGELPYTGETVKAILAAHIKADLVLPSSVSPDLGKSYDDLVKKLLVASKGYRPTAAEAVALLEPFVESRDDGKGRGRGGGGARRRRGGGATRRQSQSNNTPMILGIAGLVVMLIVGAVFLMKGSGDKGGSETGQAPPVAVNGGGTGVTLPVAGGNTPTAPPVVPTVDAAKKAFENTRAWATANSSDLGGAVSRWEAVATAHMGTEWGKKAGEELKRAKQRVEDVAAAKVRDAARAATVAADKKKRQVLLDALGRYDYEEAKRIASKHSSIEGETVQEWRTKSRRIDYLNEEFLKRLNENVEAMQIMASVIKQDAGHDEVLRSADSKGVATEAGGLPRRVEWKNVKAEDVFKLFKKFTSQRTVKDNVFLAVLARELDLARDAKMSAEVAGMVDQMGTSRDLLRRYFVDPDDASK